VSDLRAVKIDPQFRALIPPLSSDEMAQLEENVLRDGIRDALVVWLGEDVLLDGHHRYDLARKHDLAARVMYMEFKSRAEAMRWVIEHQCGRRNLSESQRAMCAARLATLTRGRPKDNPPIGGITQDDAAKMFNVSERSVSRAKAVLDHGDDKIIDAIVKDELAVSTAHEEIKNAQYKPRVNRLVFNSGTQEWFTPREYIEAARAVMGSIDVDPASCEAANATVKATEFFTKEKDGLAAKWHGNVWLNPPYAVELITKFVTVVVEKYAAAEIEQAIVLTNNSTETRWFQALLDACSAVCFPSSRIRFIDKNGNPSSSPLQGQAVFYLGDRVEEFRTVFDAFGQTSAWNKAPVAANTEEVVNAKA